MTHRQYQPPRGSDVPWTWEDHYRFEDSLQDEMEGIRREVSNLANRVTFMLGAVAVIAVVVPPVIVAVLIKGFGL